MIFHPVPIPFNCLVEDVVLSPIFNYSIMALIILNAVIMGIEIDLAAQAGQNDIPTWFSRVNEIIVVIFVLETALKLLVMGCASACKPAISGN